MKTNISDTLNRPPPATPALTWQRKKASNYYILKMKLLVTLVVCFAVAYGAVVDLTPDNFDTVVDGSKGAFVEFFAPW